MPIFVVLFRILVGAPKDNITDSNALPVVRQFVRPGVVYQCPLTTSSQDCIDVKIDRRRKFPFVSYFIRKRRFNQFLDMFLSGKM